MHPSAEKLFYELREKTNQDREVCGALSENVKRVDKETQDILHMIELGEGLSYHDFAKLSKKLREILQERRGYKDELLIRQMFIPHNTPKKLPKISLEYTMRTEIL